MSRDLWHHMDSAPHDGTPVEIRNEYGIRPTYGLYAWSAMDGWRKVGDPRTGLVDGHHLTWRPYNGDPAAYVDPTAGAQETAAYWLEGIHVSNAATGTYFGATPAGAIRPSPAVDAPRAGGIAGTDGLALSVGFVDISAQVFGKYQHCTQNREDGLFYADSDFRDGRGGGPLNPGALPSPRQSTPETTARAGAMHAAAAALATGEALTRAAGGDPAERPAATVLDEPRTPIGWPWFLAMGLLLLGAAIRTFS